MNEIIEKPDKDNFEYYFEKVLDDKNISPKRKRIYKILFYIFPFCSVLIYDMEKRNKN